MYPPHSLTNDGLRYIARGEFTNELPADVGGAGAYTHLTNSLGEAGFYVERFRGNDDLAGMTERRFKAADQLADLFIGWSRMELGQEPGYDQLHQFLDADFRRDLKNLGAYLWEGRADRQLHHQCQRGIYRPVWPIPGRTRLFNNGRSSGGIQGSQ